MIQRSRSVSDWDTESDEAEAEVDDDDGTIMDSQGASLPSDWNLSMQLELARKNSQIQHNKPLPALQMGLNDINPIYEGALTWLRPSSWHILTVFKRSKTGTCKQVMWKISKASVQ